MWWLLAIWLLAKGKQPTVSGGQPQATSGGRKAQGWRPRAQGAMTDHRSGAPNRNKPAGTWNASSADTRMPGGIPGRSVQTTLQPNEAPNPQQPDPYDPYGASAQQAAYGGGGGSGMPQTMPQSWQDDDGYGGGFDDYGDDDDGGDDDGADAGSGYFRRARAGEDADSNGMVWVPT